MNKRDKLLDLMECGLKSKRLTLTIKLTDESGIEQG